jgi:hypothetical protein
MAAAPTRSGGENGPRKSGELARTSQARSCLTGATEIALEEVMSILKQSPEQIFLCLQALHENVFTPKKDICLQKQ